MRNAGTRQVAVNISLSLTGQQPTPIATATTTKTTSITTASKQTEQTGTDSKWQLPKQNKRPATITQQKKEGWSLQLVNRFTPLEGNNPTEEHNPINPDNRKPSESKREQFPQHYQQTSQNNRRPQNRRQSQWAQRRQPARYNQQGKSRWPRSETPPRHQDPQNQQVVNLNNNTQNPQEQPMPHNNTRTPSNVEDLRQCLDSKKETQALLTTTMPYLKENFAKLGSDKNTVPKVAEPFQGGIPVQPRDRHTQAHSAHSNTLQQPVQFQPSEWAPLLGMNRASYQVGQLSEPSMQYPTWLPLPTRTWVHSPWGQ